MNRAVEDYLKTIYINTVEKDLELAKVQDVSSDLNVTIQTAHEMIKKLVTNKLVNYYPYKGVNLTNKGLKEAERMIRSHRILEVFLTETLQFNWGEVHEDAELLEHSASEKVINALYEFLGKPLTDPHGNPIPSRKGESRLMSMTSVLDLKENDLFLIERVDENKSLLNYLDKHQIKIKDQLKLISIDKELGLIEIKKDNKIYVINSQIAKNIFVKKLSL